MKKNVEEWQVEMREMRYRHSKVLAKKKIQDYGEQRDTTPGLEYAIPI